MRKILVFQHVAHEILGTLHPLLKDTGFRIRYANFGRHPDLKVDVSGYDGLVILGGPMGVYDTNEYPHLHAEIHAIQQLLRADKPILGICLGAQLIAAALGAKVEPQKEKEVGWCDLALTKAGVDDGVVGEMKGAEKIFQWHQDGFALPPEAENLATSTKCPNQAFRYRDKVYGFQFHLEVDEPLIERWLTLPGHAGWLNPALTDQIRRETPQHVSRLKDLSGKVFSRFLSLFKFHPSRVHLGSGHR